jgi:hypothetical protein
MGAARFAQLDLGGYQNLRGLRRGRYLPVAPKTKRGGEKAHPFPPSRQVAHAKRGRELAEGLAAGLCRRMRAGGRIMSGE